MPTMRRDPVSILRTAVKRWERPGLVGVACSGGADSMALADAAVAVLGTHGVVLIHIDHGLRDDSSRVGRELAAWAEGRGITCVVRAVTVGRTASLEAAARMARYGAFDAIASEVGLSAIWLAHTARDQAETVLMRVVRGTGPAGLAAMPVERDRYVRPLLDVRRDVIEDYVTVRGLPVWEDPMNVDDRITRVRFRRDLVPRLRLENPALDDALLRLASAAREWTEAIDAVAAPHARFPLACSAVRTLPPAVRKRAYALALEASALGYDAAHLDALDELVCRASGGERGVDVPGGRVVRSYDTLRLAAPADAGPALRVRAGYALRALQPGDRMKLARLKGRSRKLSDLYIDHKVPRDLRRAARVVIRLQDGEIVWAEYLGYASGETGLFEDI